MALVIFIFIIILGWLLTGALIELPLGGIQLLKLPGWAFVTGFLLVFFWYFGE